MEIVGAILIMAGIAASAVIAKGEPVQESEQ